MSNIRKFSSVVVDGYERAPSRAMLYPVGFKKEDFNKPQVGIASTWSMVTPCSLGSPIGLPVTGSFFPFARMICAT